MIDVFPIDFLINIVFYWAGQNVRNSNICHHTILSGGVYCVKIGYITLYFLTTKLNTKTSKAK